MTDLDKMARELLAAEYDRTATVGHAQMLRSTMPITTSVDKRAVNAIRAALLADHARLQEDAERLDWLEEFVRKAYVYGASFDFAKPCEGEPGGYRFMTRHRIDARQPTLRAAIDAAVSGTRVDATY